MLDKKIIAYINSALRKIFGWSEQYRMCKQRAKLENNCYRCDGCNEVIFKMHSRATQQDYDLAATKYGRFYAEKLAVDHIEPVKPVNRVLTNEEYAASIIFRMFPSVDGLQYLCECCHYLKTQIENQERRENKKCNN